MATSWSAAWRTSVPERIRRSGDLVEVAIARVGIVAGTKAAFKLLQVAYVARRAGHFPSAAEYARWAMVTSRTAFAHRAEIRAAFSDEEMRLIVAQLVEVQADELPRTKGVHVHIDVTALA